MTSVDTGDPPPTPQQGERSADGLLLVGFGPGTELRGPLEEARQRLADLLLLNGRTLPEGGGPELRMAALRQPAAPAGAGQGRRWVACLPQDPGLFLPSGGCWAEVLGAWRQPTVALLTEPQLRTGLPGAGTALLRQWRVPLLGLIQWGGAWDETMRRRDGLPWLGALHGNGDDPDRVEEEVRLRSLLRLRWGCLRLEQEGGGGEQG